ncbi:hypothetical protein [Tenacibaculum sp. 190130A14a]
MNTVAFSQQKQLYSNEINVQNLQFITNNLDDIIIENSETEKLEIILENDNTIPINIDTKEVNNELIVSFLKEEGLNPNTTVFRKYITKRLERARVLIKIPKKRNLEVYGGTVGVYSKGYAGNLNVYIEKGNVRLGKIEGITVVKLFLGNVYAEVSNTDLILKTTNGIVKINNKEKKKNFQESHQDNPFKLSVNSINANIYLTKK